MKTAYSHEHPLISVIMPAYNAAKTITESISSVLNQTYQSWELIVIDDGSTDDTVIITTAFQKKDSRVNLLKLSKNSGLPNARNEGSKIATGEFLAFLDSDDLWNSDKLKIQVAYHLQYQEVDISHTDYDFFDRKGIHKRPFKQLVSPKKNKEGYLYPHICYANPIGVLTVMMKRNLLYEVDFFDSTLRTMEDHDLWVRIASKKKKFGYINQPLALYRLSEGGLSKRMGSYKKAYKVFIAKILKNENVVSKIMWRHYYRYMGTLYFHKGELKLSRLYFCKSIKLAPYDYLAISTYIYLLYAAGKSMMQTSRNA